MDFRHDNAEDGSAIVTLFRSGFADSEGETEGELIGKLATNPLDTKG